MVFCQAYQKYLDAYKRPDSLPMTARTLMVDPGYARTPGTRRWLTRGSLFGLFIYMITYAFWWLFLKSPSKGAQSILWESSDKLIERTEKEAAIKRAHEKKRQKEQEEEEKKAEQAEEIEALVDAIAKGKRKNAKKAKNAAKAAPPAS
jgi:hypothetical protein